MQQAQEPIALAAVVGLLVLICRWVFTPSKRHARLPSPDPGSEADYGLLVPVLSTDSAEDAAHRREELRQAGVAATLGQRSGPGGPEYLLLVFPTDAGRAHRILAGQAPS